jgi:hypothetical protein
MALYAEGVIYENCILLEFNEMFNGDSSPAFKSNILLPSSVMLAACRDTWHQYAEVNLE